MSEDKTQTMTTVSPQQSSHRIGVFICECGGRISQYLDADELCLHAASLPGVIYAKHEAYPCSKDGLERINQSIQDYHLDRVLVAGCSPRLVYKHFNQAIRHPPQAGEEVRNSAHISEEIEIINIRDLSIPGENGGFSKTASKNWKDHFTNAYFDATLHHAKAMLEIGIARLTNIVPERTYTGNVVKTAIVIGDSLPGLSAALSLAADGIPVSIVQQRNKFEDTHPQPAHASWPNQQGRQFLEQRVKEVARQPLITTFTSSQMRQISGRPGDYQVVLEQNGQNTCLTAGVLLLAIDPRPGYAGINDEHTGQALSCSPDENVRRLATLLHLPQDHQGYIFEPRIRLRPGRYVDDGIYLLGSSHQPVDLHEALFQSYLTSARARRFLHQESLQLEASIAEINPELCTGCGECARSISFNEF